MKTLSSPGVTDESAAPSGGSMKQDVSAKYVDCQCVACGWLDGFKPEAITQGMVGGWCDTCGRETVFRVSKPEENKYEAMAIRRRSAMSDQPPVSIREPIKLPPISNVMLEEAKAHSLHRDGSANMSDFTRGFVCAIACLLNSHGNGTEVGDLVRCAGKTEHILGHADAEDIKTLRSYGYLPND